MRAWVVRARGRVRDHRRRRRRTPRRPRPSRRLGHRPQYQPGEHAPAGYVRVRVEGRYAGSARVWSTARRTARGRAYRVTRSRLIPVRRGRSQRGPAAPEHDRPPDPEALRLHRPGARRARVRRRGATSKRRLVRGSSRAVRADARRCSGPGARPAWPLRTPTPLRCGPVATENADRCDFLDPAACLFPWPNDAFTKSATDRDRAQAEPQQRLGAEEPGRQADRSDRP